MTTHHLTDKSFSEFGLPEALLAGIREAGFDRCTPIQAGTLPIALSGRDVAGQAQTGTGKTAAFLLATFAHLLKHPPAAERKATSPRAIMLAPTRELAIQIHKDAAVLGQHAEFKLGLVYGGTGYDAQRKMLEEGVDVLIGTPGRIIDYFKQHVFDLKAVQVMVLDEADRMFDLGFIKDIRFLLNRMPPPSARRPVRARSCWPRPGNSRFKFTKTPSCSAATPDSGSVSCTAAPATTPSAKCWKTAWTC